MNLADLVRFASTNIWAQKLRTVLTLAAISVGALLVYLLPSLGLGVAHQIREQFVNRAGYDKIVVHPKYEERPTDFTKADFTPLKLLRKIEPTDLVTLTGLDTVKAISVVAFDLRPERVHLDAINQDLPAGSGDFSGSNPGSNAYIPPTDITILRPGLPPADYGVKLAAGTFFAENSPANTTVINQAIVDGFHIADVQAIIGSTLTLTFSEQLPANDLAAVTARQQERFTIIGVVTDAGGAPANGPAVLLPFERALAIHDWQIAKNPDARRAFTFSAVTVIAQQNDQVEALNNRLKELGFSTFTSLDAIKEFKQILNIALGILAAIGLIALFVGSLNIVNTLMMAVSERTKEIGILRALGASRMTIRSLFLVESAVIALLGAAVGVGLGWAISFPVNSWIVARAYQGVADTSGLPTEFFDYSWALMVAVVAFVTGVGLLAGLAPAIRASRLNVVDALRYE